MSPKQAALVGLSLLAAQPSPAQAIPPARLAGAEACRAVANRRDLIGVALADALAALNFPNVRVIRPGDAPVSMDLLEDRLNLVTTADGRVADLWCG
jgi:hypothetical protein